MNIVIDERKFFYTIVMYKALYSICSNVQMSIQVQ
jgi:hypothetical protein